MLRKLSPNPQERLKDRFRDHPLMQTCQKVFLHYMASMEQFDFTNEDLFVEVAEVIDCILDNPQGARQYLENLWDTLKIKLKRKAPTTPPQADLETVCGVLYYVVAATFCLHWREFYNTELVNMLRGVVERKRLFADSEEEIISNLCHHADALDEWINHYDESDEWLSDEIKVTLEEEPQEDDGLALPKELNTKRARQYFAKAIDRGYMKQEGGAFRWVGTDDKGRTAELAYFLGRVYNYEHTISGNAGEDFPEESLNRLFGVKRLYSSLTQVYEAKKPQRWRSQIDELFD